MWSLGITVRMRIFEIRWGCYRNRWRSSMQSTAIIMYRRDITSDNLFDGNPFYNTKMVYFHMSPDFNALCLVPIVICWQIDQQDRVMRSRDSTTIYIDDIVNCRVTLRHWFKWWTSRNRNGQRRWRMPIRFKNMRHRTIIGALFLFIKSSPTVH